MRADRAFTQGLPTVAVAKLRRHVARSERTLDSLARSLAADSPACLDGRSCED